jgi:hypothetical protein
MEVSAQAPSADDLEAFCPYQVEPYLSSPGYAVNVKAWLKSEQRRQSERKAKQ